MTNLRLDYLTTDCLTTARRLPDDCQTTAKRLSGRIVNTNHNYTSSHIQIMTGFALKNKKILIRFTTSKRLSAVKIYLCHSTKIAKAGPWFDEIPYKL